MLEDHAKLRPIRMKNVISVAGELAAPYRVIDGKSFHLKDIDPRDTGTLEAEDKPGAKGALQIGIDALAEMQDMLYAQDRWAVLLIFQAMDAAGKDGAIKHVMSGVNPQGCEVYSFKGPGPTELDHDYLWRTHLRAPERGRIGIFNRSYYEEVLVVRVHPEILESQKLPPGHIDGNIWDDRLKDIRNFERYLARNGVAICKFFLHVSRNEQKRRFLERLEQPEKNWKFSPNDVRERPYWKDYMRAYEDAIRATATEDAPWYVVPADNKWFTRVVVAAATITTLASLGLQYPKVDKAKKKDLATAKRVLLRER
jgi:PPK2 family polyphosphate:nucleotide phosphotransferase